MVIVGGGVDFLVLVLYEQTGSRMQSDAKLQAADVNLSADRAISLLRCVYTLGRIDAVGDVCVTVQQYRLHSEPACGWTVASAAWQYIDLRRLPVARIKY